MIRRVYLAGPMSGIPQFNFPAFDAAAKDLRTRGYEVVSPAELDAPATRAAALASEHGEPGQYVEDTGETWGDLLARDVKLIADEGIEAIVVLDGWEKSRGARLETFVARLCGVPVVEYQEDSPMVGLFEPDLKNAHGWIPETESVGWVVDPGPPASVDTEAPHGEERITNEATGGQKGRKAERMELIPFDVLMEDVAPLYAFGAKKYAAHNYRKGYDWSLSFGAMMRHATLFWHGEDLDAETECPHLASVVFHALALLLFVKTHPELDDRPPVA